MLPDRRQFLIGAAGLAVPAAIPAPVPAQSDSKGTRLILLGTKGGPALTKHARANPGTLLLIRGVPYVVDCGYGTSRQLVSAGVALNTVRHIFITHHHSDHNLELGAIPYNAWAAGSFGRIDVYGPPGLERMNRAFLDYLEFDIETRIADEGRPDFRKLVFFHELGAPGPVMENEDVKVTSLFVRHPPIRHAFAFRFDTKTRSVVLSGDTAYAPELARFTRGADVLVHEALYLPGLEALLRRVPDAARLREHLVASHTTPEDAGRIAAEAGVSTLVLSHLVPGDDPSITDEQWAAGARRFFKGRIVVGRDLMEVSA